MVDSVYIDRSTPLRAFIGSFQHFGDMLQTYWRCAWRSLMQKKYFLTNLQSFQFSHFFNTLKICCRHIEDVYEEVWCRKNIFWQTVCRGYQVSRTYCQVSFALRPMGKMFTGVTPSEFCFCSISFFLKQEQSYQCFDCHQSFVYTQIIYFYLHSCIFLSPDWSIDLFVSPWNSRLVLLLVNC